MKRVSLGVVDGFRGGFCNGLDISVLRGATVVVALLAGWLQGHCRAAESSAATRSPLLLEQVLESVSRQYPPLLGALIERDIAAGRMRSTLGSFDFQTFAKYTGIPHGYYEQHTIDLGFEQFTGIWGSTIFGGYRLSRGGRLPDYDKNRTQGEGEPRLGLRIPLLRDGSIDRRRAAVMQARLDQELADPFIQRQQLDFIRAATVSYFSWVAGGRRWRVTEELLRIATARAEALTNQVTSGLVPKIVLTDNERLIVSRRLSTVQARRRFEAAAIALSMFYRDADGSPRIKGREALPEGFPDVPPPMEQGVDSDVSNAMNWRPEVRRVLLNLDKAEIDRKLARNNLLPNLDAGVSVSRDFGERLYRDKTETEVETGLEFKMPLQRREAKGRLEVIEGQIERLRLEERFARDRIEADVRDAFSALNAAWQQIDQAKLNVTLAQALEEAEATRFQRGAADLLALQIREQATFDAKLSEIESVLEYFRAQADYEAASARFARPNSSSTKPTAK